MTGWLMRVAQQFAEITTENVPLAPLTHLGVGGPAEALMQPRSRDELAAVVRACAAERVPFRVLGTGCGVIVRDAGVKGVVLRLSAPAFTEVEVKGLALKAGAGTPLATLIAEAARHGLGGPESLVGIPGTVGGALRGNAGDRSGEIGQFVRRVEALDVSGNWHVREQDELQFAYRESNLEDAILVAADFEMDGELTELIVKRLRKAWIQRKAAQPFTFQAAVRMFKDPRGQSAAALIEQAGLGGTRVGGAELSERDANAVVAQPGASARDVLRLIETVAARVRERFHVELELQVSVW